MKGTMVHDFKCAGLKLGWGGCWSYQTGKESINLWKLSFIYLYIDHVNYILLSFSSYPVILLELC